MPQRLAVGQFVQGGMGERALAGAELAQDRRGGALAQPAQYGGGTLVTCQVVIKRLQGRPDRAVVAAEQVTQPLAQLAGHAPSGGDAAVLSAARAAAPEPRAGEGAGRAQRRVSGAGADRRDRAAVRAAGPALLACPAPGLAGGLGDHARAVLSADRAGQHLPGPAVLAQRPVRSAGADRTAPPAPGAFLLVSRIGDQAVRAQRPAVLIASGGFPDGAAPGARLGPGLGHAVAAAPQPADPPVKTDDPLATRAGREGNGLGPGVAQLADQPQHAADRGMRAAAGQQARVLFDDPGEFLQVSGLREHAPRRCADRFSGQRGIHRGNRGSQDRQRIPVIPVGTVLAARLPVAVNGGNDPVLAAGRAALRPADAHAAVPVLASALERAQRLAARHADRRGDHDGAGLAQRDQQVPDDPRCRRLTIGQDHRPLGEGLGELAPLGAAIGDAHDRLLGQRRIQARLGAGDQGDGDADRVGQHVRDVSGHRSAAGPRDPDAPGAAGCRPRPPPRSRSSPSGSA